MMMLKWGIIIGMGAITYGIRLVPILLLERINLPPTMQRALRFVPASVLSAIIFPELLLPGGILDFSWGNERLISGFIAALIAWRTRNILLTIVIGMISLWLLQ